MINEAIDRVTIIPQFADMIYLNADADIPIRLPSNFHYLLAIYACARAFDMDERFYEGTQKMNEFETKLDELQRLIEEGKVVIKDGDGEAITDTSAIDYIKDVYFYDSQDIDVDGSIWDGDE